MAPARPRSGKPTSKCPACDTSPYGAPLPDPSIPLQLCQKCMDKHARIPSSDARNNPVSLARAGMSGPFLAASPSTSSLKRKFPSSAFEPLPEEDTVRTFSSDDEVGGNNYTPSSDSDESPHGPLMRSSVGGLPQAREIMRDGSRPEYESEDEFVDAAEDLPSSTSVRGNSVVDGTNFGEGGEQPKKVRRIGYVEIPRREHQNMKGVSRFGEEYRVTNYDKQQENEDDGTPDLFDTAFGNEESAMDISSDDESNTNSRPPSDSQNDQSDQPSPPPKPKPNTKTKPPSHSNTTTSTSSDDLPCPIDPFKHTSAHLKTVTKFHHRALQFLPRLPLAPHRYWIGVLNHNESGRSVHSEKQFTWLRGNRLTTIRTVWRKYAEVNVVEGFALYIGGTSLKQRKGEDERVVLGGGPVERPGMGVRMEELDYCGDRRVILRALCRTGLKKGPDLEVSGQRGLFEALMRERREVGGESEVVVLDDD